MTERTSGDAGVTSDDVPAGTSRLKVGPRAAAAAAVIVACLLLAAFVLYARGGGPVPRALSFLSPGTGDLLAPSGPQETVLRTLRLVGIERAAVGESGGTAVVRLEVPGVSSAGDIEIAWQAGMAALVEGYPRASVYSVQVFADGTALVEVRADDAAAALEAVGEDDIDRLRELVTMVLLPAEEAADE